ncbi:transposase [Chloroflexi bacterium TSY]|nr:transposase [Chloroflexi bacterium TSY]
MKTLSALDTIVPIEMKPGKKWRYDHHYERKGICYILIAYQPHTGQRVVQITERRRGQEYARFMHDLKTKHNPDADSLQIVQDNLNIHSPSSFYTIFSRGSFRSGSALSDGLYPVNGSWLNMVEIELSVITRQVLDRRIDSKELLETVVLALVNERNEQSATIQWQFTPALARQKFQRFYPVLDTDSDDQPVS